MYVIPATQSFPILKLPFIPLHNVIQSFSPLEALDFSLTSRKCRNIVKSTNLFKYDIGLSLLPEQTLFRLYRNLDREHLVCRFSVNELRNKNRHMEVKGILKPYLNERKRISLHFAKVWLSYLCDVLQMKLKFLQMNPSSSIEQMFAVAEWMNSMQPEIWLCEFHDGIVKSESITRFFEIANFPIRFLSFEVIQRSDTGPINCGALNVEDISVATRTNADPVNWFNIEQIKTWNCVRLMLMACKFEERDLNQLVKGWLNGCNSRLEFFSAILDPLDFNIILEDIEFEERDETLTRLFHTSLTTLPLSRTFIGGYDITRSDGTVATLQQINRFPGPRPMWEFAMAVWP
ncbi:hypothetical protein CRE_01366 [Caenorhabditis remanei]|uniref:F-box domain-containing protein n=1 Tax=Caenorhabditis remanei TaxID=31234 RepID=E3ND81_CAERE|nr:hypothetical protein CRE_01366 [Caenorhabditis remanei]